MALTLLLVSDWHAEVVDVSSAVLHGELSDGTQIHMEVPNGFEKYYPPGNMLRLQRTFYGLKQVARAF